MLEALQNAEKLLDNLHIGVVLHAPDTSILFANSSALNLLHLTLEQAQGRVAIDPHWHFVDEYKVPLSQEAYPVNKVLATQSELINYVIGINDIQWEGITWVQVNAYPVFDDYQQIQQVAITMTDITQHRQDIPFEAIVSNANDVVLVTEAQNIEGPEHPKIVYVNQAFSDLTGYSFYEIVGLTPRVLQGINTDPKAKMCIKKAIQKQQSVSCQLLNYKKNGEEYWIEINISPLRNSLGQVVYFAAIERDITIQKQRELNLKKQADIDFLTQIPNRRSFTGQANMQIHNAQQHPITMVMLDIDYFKKVNDTYGHGAGDLILKQLGQQLSQNFRSQDLLVRLGGEEFGILLTQTDRFIAYNLMEKFRQKIAKMDMPIGDGHSINIEISIGIYTLKDRKESLEEIIERADLALYRAKELGRNQTQVYGINATEISAI